METSLTNCPACHVPAYAGEYAEPLYKTRCCPYCGGEGEVSEERAEDISEELDEQAEVDRCARRGRHVSGVRFEGPV